MKAAIIVFPGTNCDRDTYNACNFFGWQSEYVWHDENDLSKYDLVFLPGGFSYGDYIHSGRLAKFSPIIKEVKDFIYRKQGMVIGICNGFQILCESNILSGVLTNNITNKFLCDEVCLEFNGSEITLPIAHKEGRYICNDIKEEMIFLKYKDNPNGSVKNIAGIYDKENRVLGMMPHPERAVFKELGNTDGQKIFEFIQKELN